MAQRIALSKIIQSMSADKSIYQHCIRFITRMLRVNSEKECNFVVQQMAGIDRAFLRHSAEQSNHSHHSKHSWPRIIALFIAFFTLDFLRFIHLFFRHFILCLFKPHKKPLHLRIVAVKVGEKCRIIALEEIPPAFKFLKQPFQRKISSFNSE